MTDVYTIDPREADAERRQALIDQQVDQYWRESGHVENAISENADLLADLLTKLNNDAIGRDDFAERMLSSVDHWLTCQAEEELS